MSLARCRNEAELSDVTSLLIPCCCRIFQFTFKPGLIDMCSVILCSLSFFCDPCELCHISIAIYHYLLKLQQFLIATLFIIMNNKKINFSEKRTNRNFKNAGLINMVLLKEIVKLIASYVKNKL